MERYHYRDIYEDREFDAVPVINGIDQESGKPYRESYVTVRVDDGGEKNLPFLLSEKDRVEVKTQAARTLQAPVAENAEVGTVCYYLNGDMVRRYPIVTTEAVKERTYRFICSYLLQEYLF